MLNDFILHFSNFAPRSFWNCTDLTECLTGIDKRATRSLILQLAVDHIRFKVKITKPASNEFFDFVHSIS